MATDFAPYANLRMVWTPPGVVTSFRDGVPAAGAPIVIEVFLKGAVGAPQALPSVKATSGSRSGFITQWATVPSGVNWLAARSAFSWNTTGLTPDGLLPGAKGSAFLGKLENLPTRSPGGMLGQATISELFGAFGVGGIGDELRQNLGDAITVAFEVPA